MAQTFEGNSSALLRTECCYSFNKTTCLQCIGQASAFLYFVAQMPLKTAKAFITDMSIHLSTSEPK